MLWTGRSRGYEPEGQEVTDRTVDTGMTGRSTGIRDGSPLRHMDRKILQSYGLERHMCGIWYFGELTKLRAYRYVLCVSGTSDDREKAPS